MLGCRTGNGLNIVGVKYWYRGENVGNTVESLGSRFPFSS